MDELWELPPDIQSYIYDNNVPLHIYSSPISDAFDGVEPEVGIATTIVSNDEAEILFIEHSEEDRFWELPSGHIEEGENPENAARREVREETGFLITEVEPLFIIIWPFETTVRIQIVFSARVGERVSHSDGESNQVVWREDVPENVTFGELGQQMYEYYIEHSSVNPESSYLKQGIALVGLGFSAAAFKGLQAYRERKTERDSQTED